MPSGRVGKPGEKSTSQIMADVVPPDGSTHPETLLGLGNPAPARAPSTRKHSHASKRTNKFCLTWAWTSNSCAAARIHPPRCTPPPLRCALLRGHPTETPRTFEGRGCRGCCDNPPCTDSGPETKLPPTSMLMVCRPRRRGPPALVNQKLFAHELEVGRIVLLHAARAGDALGELCRLLDGLRLPPLEPLVEEVGDAEGKHRRHAWGASDQRGLRGRGLGRRGRTPGGGGWSPWDKGPKLHSGSPCWVAILDPLHRLDESSTTPHQLPGRSSWATTLDHYWCFLPRGYHGPLLSLRSLTVGRVNFTCTVREFFIPTVCRVVGILVIPPTICLRALFCRSYLPIRLDSIEVQLARSSGIHCHGISS